MADLDISVVEAANRQFKVEEKIPRSKKKHTIKELTKRNKWKFW